MLSQTGVIAAYLEPALPTLSESEGSTSKHQLICYIQLRRKRQKLLPCSRRLAHEHKKPCALKRMQLFYRTQSSFYIFKAFSFSLSYLPLEQTASRHAEPIPKSNSQEQRGAFEQAARARAKACSSSTLVCQKHRSLQVQAFLTDIGSNRPGAKRASAYREGFCAILALSQRSRHSAPLQ